MGNKVIRKGFIENAVCLSKEMISHPVWAKHPKLFHLWVYIQSSREVTYGSMAKALGCEKKTIEKNIKKLKTIGSEFGIELLSTNLKLFDADNKVKVVEYIISNNDDCPLDPRNMYRLNNTRCKTNKDPVIREEQKTKYNISITAKDINQEIPTDQFLIDAAYGIQIKKEKIIIDYKTRPPHTDIPF